MNVQVDDETLKTQRENVHVLEAFETDDDISGTESDIPAPSSSCSLSAIATIQYLHCHVG